MRTSAWPERGHQVRGRAGAIRQSTEDTETGERRGKKIKEPEMYQLGEMLLNKKCVCCPLCAQVCASKKNI